MRKSSIFLIVVLAIFLASISFAAQQPEMKVVIENITEGETAYAHIVLPVDAQGNVSVLVNDKNFTSDVVNGNATVELKNLKAGDYKVNVTYEGSGNYSKVSKLVDLKVNSTKNNTPENTSSDNQTNITPASNDTPKNASGDKTDIIPANNTQNSTVNVVNYTNNTNVVVYNTTNISNNTTNNVNQNVTQVVKQTPKKEPQKPQNVLTDYRTGLPILVLILVVVVVVIAVAFRRK